MASEIKNNSKIWTLKEKILEEKEKCKENGKTGKHGEEETGERRKAKIKCWTFSKAGKDQNNLALEIYKTSGAGSSRAPRTIMVSDTRNVPHLLQKQKGGASFLV